MGFSIFVNSKNIHLVFKKLLDNIQKFLENQVNVFTVDENTKASEAAAKDTSTNNEDAPFFGKKLCVTCNRLMSFATEELYQLHVTKCMKLFPFVTKSSMVINGNTKMKLYNCKLCHIRNNLKLQALYEHLENHHFGNVDLQNDVKDKYNTDQPPQDEKANDKSANETVVENPNKSVSNKQQKL